MKKEVEDKKENTVRDEWNYLIGKTLGEAREALEEGMSLRVIMYNSTPAIVTCDFRTDRVNVAITDGKVSSVKGIG